MKIPFFSFKGMHRPIKDEILQSFEKFYDKEWYILGEELVKFEESYAKFNLTDYAIGVSTGLDALHLALKSLNIGENDEVLVPSNTYIASLLAVSFVGARPVLVEPDPFTYNIDFRNISKFITSRTKAIMPVHLYGQACNMEEITSIADKFGLFVIEDNSQAHLANWKGKLTGSWGHINATSFYPGKNLGALGDAGAITTNDLVLANFVRTARNYGSQKKYFNDIIGYNNRLDECQASFLNVKLKYIGNWTSERQNLASLYFEFLNGIGDLILPFTAVGASHVYHLYVIRTKFRERLIQHLSDNGVGTLIHYPVPPHLQLAYKHLGFSKGSYPIAEELADTCLSLPLYPGMVISEIKYVSDCIIDFFNRL